MEIDMTPEKAEQELIELIRGEDAKSFFLRITVDNGEWVVASGLPEHDGPEAAVGRGASFAEAWFDQNPQ